VKPTKPDKDRRWDKAIHASHEKRTA
jgi:hypothetical protein